MEPGLGTSLSHLDSSPSAWPRSRRCSSDSRGDCCCDEPGIGLEFGLLKQWNPQLDFFCSIGDLGCLDLGFCFFLFLILFLPLNFVMGLK